MTKIIKFGEETKVSLPQPSVNFRQLLIDNAPAVVFSGAGMSEESGIETFRSKGGLWDKYDPMEYCSIEGFKKNPLKVWMLIGERGKSIRKSKPNKGHHILSKLQEEGLISHIITQNIDGYHQKAGSKNVLEIHGSIESNYCLTCQKEPTFILTSWPRRCGDCKQILKPGVTLFGESLPEAFDHAVTLSNTCKMMIVIGTSGLVAPAADIPWYASMRGIPVVEINPEPAEFASPNLTIQETSSKGLERFLKEGDRDA